MTYERAAGLPDRPDRKVHAVKNIRHRPAGVVLVKLPVLSMDTAALAQPMAIGVHARARGRVREQQVWWDGTGSRAVNS